VLASTQVVTAAGTGTSAILATSAMAGTATYKAGQRFIQGKNVGLGEAVNSVASVGYASYNLGNVISLGSTYINSKTGAIDSWIGSLDSAIDTNNTYHYGDITKNAGYVNPYGTGGRLNQDMAGATANSGMVGCIKAPVDYGNSNFSDIDSKLINGSSMKTDEVLDLASEFLGKGYTEPVSGSGRFVSQDGLRVFRMGDRDILGKHGGGPHVNFEYLEPNPLKPGKMQIIKDIHIYLED
jgi:hypothetical protein